MDVARYYCGFSSSEVGGLTLSVADDGNGISFVATVDGRFYLDLDDTGAKHGYHSSLRAELEAAIVAAASAASSSVTWELEYDNAAMTFTLRATGGAGEAEFTMTEALGYALGMDGTGATTTDAGEASSLVRPYYVIAPNIDGVHVPREHYDATGATETAVAEGSATYGVGRTTRTKMIELEQQFEPAAAVYDHRADPAVPFTWEKLFHHVGTREPICIVGDASVTDLDYDTDVEMKIKLRDDGALLRTRYVERNIATEFHVPFAGFMISRGSAVGSSGSGGGGGGGGGSPPTMTAVSGFSSSDYYKTSGGAVWDGEDEFTHVVIARLDSLPSGAQYLAGKGSAGSASWHLQADTLLGFKVDGSLSPTRSIVAGDVGDTFIIHAVSSVADGNVRLYVDGAEVGSGTAIATYSTNTVVAALGDRQDGRGEAATAWSVVGYAVGDGVAMSAADIAAHVAAIKAAGDLTTFTGCDHRYLASAGIGTDQDGSEDLTAVGSLTTTAAFVPSYAS